MSEGKMELTYHPVLKEIRFRRWENGRWVEAGDERSILHKYVSEDNQLLQNLGDEFFADIIRSMDNCKLTKLNFIGTREDYEDLKRMIEHFEQNKQNENRSISIGEFTELPAVRELFEDIMHYSNETSAAFQEKIEEIETEGHQSEVGSICNALKEWLGALELKREGLKENVVNLCFVGSYSSGKSTLINALIGEAILPEAIESKTAKMFRITQIPSDSPDMPSISFCLRHDGGADHVRIQWEDGQRVSLLGWPPENPIRGAVQGIIDDNAGNRRHIQMSAVLTCLNDQPGSAVIPDGSGGFRESSSYIDGIIHIRYPFDMKAGVLFQVYDTPGTDSNSPEHLRTLKTALEDPASSILVYVNEPSKMEGTANAILLDILGNKESKSGSSGSTIDLSRSFFVVNKADTLKDEQAVRDLQNKSLLLIQAEQERAEEEGAAPKAALEIRLKEKRLFFTDALHAVDARAVKKGIDTSDERGRLKDNRKLVDTEWYRFYQYDIMAQAGADTKQLVDDAEEKRLALEEEGKAQADVRLREWTDRLMEISREDPDNLPVFLANNPQPQVTSGGLPVEAHYVCSGVYSLQKEIEKYAERFALAVRAKGIIDATRELNNNTKRKCQEIENALEKNIEDLKKQTDAAKNELSGKIGDICKIDEYQYVSEVEAKELGLDIDAVDGRIKALRAKLKPGIWPELEVMGTSKLDKRANWAKNVTQEEISAFHSDYSKKCKDLLERKQDQLMRQIAQTIDAQKELDDDTKERLKDVRKQTIQRPTRNSISDISVKKYFDDFLFVHWIKSGKLTDELVDKFGQELDKLKEEYKSEYQETLNNLRAEIQKQYQDRIDEFAGEVIRLEQNRKGVQDELDKLKKILDEVLERDEQLERKIYSEKAGEEKRL